MVSILVSKIEPDLAIKEPPESDGTTTWTPKAIESTSPRNAKQRPDTGNSIRFSGTETSQTLVQREMSLSVGVDSSAR